MLSSTPTKKGTRAVASVRRLEEAPAEIRNEKVVRGKGTTHGPRFFKSPARAASATKTSSGGFGEAPRAGRILQRAIEQMDHEEEARIGGRLYSTANLQRRKSFHIPKSPSTGETPRPKAKDGRRSVNTPKSSRKKEPQTPHKSPLRSAKVPEGRTPKQMTKSPWRKSKHEPKPKTTPRMSQKPTQRLFTATISVRTLQLLFSCIKPHTCALDALSALFVLISEEFRARGTTKLEWKDFVAEFWDVNRIRERLLSTKTKLEAGEVDVTFLRAAQGYLKDYTEHVGKAPVGGYRTACEEVANFVKQAIKHQKALGRLPDEEIFRSVTTVIGSQVPTAEEERMTSGTKDSVNGSRGDTSKTPPKPTPMQDNHPVETNPTREVEFEEEIDCSKKRTQAPLLVRAYLTNPENSIESRDLKKVVLKTAEEFSFDNKDREESADDRRVNGSLLWTKSSISRDSNPSLCSFEDNKQQLLRILDELPSARASMEAPAVTSQVKKARIQTMFLKAGATRPPE
eukprot:TRINITY_DN4939_c0_g2_i1.p1 TRINITY_DN4939_c0_g2~~TRINITY_DN4939_c0_g2_i1.p1  ORF type:complete len:513 (-),score=106.73 TRINITY_DN4939_c0_g2_i1:588-2126(-)